MGNAKEQVSRILQQLPEDCSIEDVQYELYVMETIRQRLAAADEGKFVSHAEVEQRLGKWLIE